MLICRDTYWKIAWNWKPDYTSDNDKYSISYFNGEIVMDNEMHTQHIFDFPTEEMRDAFYENFKELIEECKELL